MSEVNERVDDLDHERSRLVRVKDSALEEAEVIFSQLYDDYHLRRLFYYILDENNMSLPFLSERMDMRERMVQELLDRLIEDKVIEVEED